MAKSGVKVTSILSGKWLEASERELDIAVLEIATDIDKRAKMLAPRDTSALINSGRIERIRSGFYSVIFGNNAVPYARRRHYENFKNPQTLGYLAKAGDSVTRGNVSKYLRKK